MKLKTIKAHRETKQIIFNIFIATFICFIFSYFALESLIISYSFLIVIAILFIKEYLYKVSISKIEVTQESLIKIDLIKSGKREEVYILKDYLTFEFKKILHGKMLNIDYHIYLKGLDEKIELTAFQGWKAKELMAFLDENGVGYRII